MEEKILNKIKNDFIKKEKIKTEVIISYDEENFFEEMDKIIKKFEKETEEFEKKQKDLIHKKII